MCLICVDFQKQRMTITDARRALREMSSILEDEHVREVQEMIREAEKAARENDAADKP